MEPVPGTGRTADRAWRPHNNQAITTINEWEQGQEERAVLSRPGPNYSELQLEVFVRLPGLRNRLGLFVTLSLFSLPVEVLADPADLMPSVARILQERGIRVGGAEPQMGWAQAASEARDDAAAVSLDAAVDDSPVVLGLIVKFSGEEAARLAAANEAPPDALLEALEAASWEPLEFLRPMSLGRFVFRFPEPLSYADYEALEAALLDLEIVDSVSADMLNEALLTPNDPDFSAQWNLLRTGMTFASEEVFGINAIAAWDLVTETNAITVAVVDSGISNPAPVSLSRLLPGYDFISDPESARDGDGRDANPRDQGSYFDDGECNQEKGESSDWHGTKMASLVAAEGNDGQNIAGIDWRARILPVRVLGKCGRGTNSDIVDGMMWAAGLPVPGVPANANPAQIINLSLTSVRGAPGCDSLYEDAIVAIRRREVLVVAAAGNDDKEGAMYQPASCWGVLSVGAATYRGERASYSNWSEMYAVDFAVPVGGGGTTRILALGDAGTREPVGKLAVYPTSGTSAAAAIASGALSLALRVDPLQHHDVMVATLFVSLQPFAPNTECSNQFPRCGLGLLELEKFIQATVAMKDYALVRDFYHESLNHYFRAGNWDEVSLILRGNFGAWEEQDDVFLAWRNGNTAGVHPVCRFYGTPGIGPNSHFYTVDQDECDFIKANDPGWTYEGTAFYAKKLNSLGACPRNTKKLYRYYNQRAQFNDSNHRYATHLNDRQAMEAAGWVLEGVAMCVVD